MLMVGLGAAIAFSSFAAVRAEHASPDKSKTFSYSGGAACLQAKSSGPSTPAFIGTASSGLANGVVGNANEGDGLYGSSALGYGIVGSSSGDAGVFGSPRQRALTFSLPGFTVTRAAITSPFSAIAPITSVPSASRLPVRTVSMATQAAPPPASSA